MIRQAILLMGATASGKTELAVKLCERFACDIISVDSALVYRGMDIGTAKPTSETLHRAPHQLIDIRDPEQSYSAGDFVRDARSAMESSFANHRIPLLAGGTMMYFRALTQGIAELPAADANVRREIDRQAHAAGWPAVHAELAKVDRQAAARINPNDSQRIQRALEVFRISGRSLSDWQKVAADADHDIEYVKIALQIEPRSILHQRIEQRLDAMIAGGFIDEMHVLMARPGILQDCSAMRSVGYRQFWRHLAGDYSLQEARDRALYATRQLAKRQITWLRSEKGAFVVNPLEVDTFDTISTYLEEQLA